MIHVRRYQSNPILSPNPNNNWEAYAVLNASIIKKENKYHLFYRAISDFQNWQDSFIRVSSIGQAISQDGYSFQNRSQFIVPEYDWERFGCEDPRVISIDKKYYIFYTAISGNPPMAENIRVGVAVSKDLQSIEEKHLVTPFNAKAMILFPEKINKKYLAMLTVDTDNPPAKIAIAYLDNLEQLWDKPFWDEWRKNISRYTLPLIRKSTDHLEVGLAPLKIKDGWLFIFSYIQNYFTSKKTFGIEAAILDHKNPLQIKNRTTGPFMVPETYPELYGTIPNIIFPSGGLIEKNNVLRMYYGASDTSVCEADFFLPEMIREISENKQQIPLISTHTALHANRFEGNPILEPLSCHTWEEKAVLNAGILNANKKIYILYRAMDNNLVSNIGLALTSDGFHIQERLAMPIFTPHESFEVNESGGSFGAEDPRVTQINEELIMHYTAYNGKIPRVSHTKISLSSFLARNWNWQKAQVISAPDVLDKDSTVFPEKIGGKYAIIHRLKEDIYLDFAYDFSEFGENKRWLGGKILFSPRANFWDSKRVGIGSQPIKTSLGWLIVYHGISEKDLKYRLGIVILDYNNISKLVFRSNLPILEPKLHYENNGLRPGTVFTCGAVIFNDDFFIYYGSSDSVLCVARINYKFLINELKK